MVEIRRAVHDDAHRVAELASDLGYTISPGSVGTAIDRLSSEDGALFVADTGSGLIGWIHIYRTHVVQTEPFASVGGLVVDPLRRGTGVGRRLLEAAEQWASAGGLGTIRVRSNIVRSYAHQFYERSGFAVEKTSYTFIKHLNDA